MRTPPTALALRQARRHLLEHGYCPPEGMDERVAKSWRRSLAAGLLPTDRRQTSEHASAADLNRALTSQHELLVHSRPVMDVLYEMVQANQSMVVLADARGTLMHTLGHADFLQRAQQVALSCGASWSEQHSGTNAIGTVLAEGCGLEIHGGEHFFEHNDFLTCTAAPILSAKGELMGVLDISSDQRTGQLHTFGLVSMAARMIENRLIGATCQQHILLHLHPQQAGLGTVAEGIVVLSGDGWVMGGNGAGLALLGLSKSDLGAVQIRSVLEMSLDALLSLHKRRPGQAQQVRLRGGDLLFAVVRQDGATVATSGGTLGASRAPVVSVDAAGTDALALLDTGDVRWRNASDKARRVLDKPIPLLIQGESGVGKEMFARAAHHSGPRRNQPFVAINCAAVPENLIEAELFGYSPGAFTGARREGSPGRLREAHGGTLFLDEIGDMPLSLQARLLRVLQERQVSPLGGGPAVAVDFALICATHCKLRQAAEAGHFRSDLYYRINGLTVHLPALRERTDFDVLTRHLLQDINPDVPVAVAPELLTRLKSYAWPGNLRQYANALRTASAMLEPGETVLDWVHLADDLLEELAVPALSAPAPPGATLTSAPALTPAHNLHDMSQLAIRQAMQDAGGNLSQAARRLGISRQTLYRKLSA